MTIQRAPLLLVANARMPSQRAQSLQVAQCAAAYARAGAPTTLLYAKRHGTPVPASADELLDHYDVPVAARPKVEAVACVDWIDRVPRSLQYAPARVQELSFARAAARRVRQEPAETRVLCREIDCAYWLGERAGVFVEVHRVPAGRKRRQWLASVAQRAAGFVAISGGVAEDLIEAGVAEDRILVEHDGFQPERFANMPSRADARRELGLDPDGFVVVYTGGLLAWKGVDVLVDAARLLPKLHFVIAGGMDRDVERLRAYAQGLGNVRIDGFQPPSRVSTYLAAGDLGVVPNRSEPLISSRYTSPLKAFEAMAAKIPLIVSDLLSLRDVLGPKEAYFVEPEDPRALALGIAHLAQHDQEREALAEHLGARAQDHTWDARALRILDWMEE